jgi:allantoin racemase
LQAPDFQIWVKAPGNGKGQIMKEKLIRILWQSSTAIDGLPAYIKAIKRHADQVLYAGSSLEIRGVSRGSNDLQFRSIDFMNNLQVFESGMRAESEGFDAVALGCFVDPVLDELREVVDIPVLGMAETGMHLACQIGRRFAVLTRTAAFSPKFHRELVLRYGLESRCSGHYAFDCAFEEVVEGLEGKSDAALGQLQEVATTAVNDGAEVLLLGCGVLNLVAVRAGITELAGARLLDVSGALMKMAETMVSLRRTTGLSVNRCGYYEKPSAEQLDAALESYRLNAYISLLKQ